MKYVLLIAIVWVAYMLWRKGRIAAPPDGSSPRAGAGQPQDMVCCPVCSVHLPRAEAVAGPDGRLFCSQEHRLRGSA